MHQMREPRTFRILAHDFNLLRGYFPFERAKPAQAKTMFLGNPIDLFHTFAREVFAKSIILKFSIQCQGDGLSHTSIGPAGRKPEVKMKINGSWHIDHTAVNH